jgi:hypothetical protein
VRAASGGNFDGPYEPAAVALIYAAGGVRVGLFQPLDQFSEWQALEFRAQWVIRRNVNQLITFDYSADVQTGSAHEEGQFPSSSNGVNGAVSGPLILRQREIFGHLGDVYEVVFDRPGLGWGYLSRAQVQAAINLAGVGGDDFTAEVIRQAKAELALSGGIGPEYDD